MNYLALRLASALTASALLWIAGQVAVDSSAAPAAAKADDAGDLAALKQSANEFAEAFNRADAAAVAALWTPNGEYIDDAGNRFEGRDTIAKEYAAFFAAHPGAVIAISIDALRKVADNVAVEDGVSVVQVTALGLKGYGKYTATHVKTDGRWLMASVREARAEPAGGGDPLSELKWLVGSWRAEENGGVLEAECRLVADGRFLESQYWVKRADQIVAGGIQVIGVNPQSRGIQSWSFTSDGGYAIGAWLPGENGWTIHMRGAMGDGTPTQATNLVARLSDDAYSWASVGQSAGEIKLPDAPEVVLKRAGVKPAIGAELNKTSEGTSP